MLNNSVKLKTILTLKTEKAEYPPLEQLKIITKNLIIKKNPMQLKKDNRKNLVLQRKKINNHHA